MSDLPRRKFLHLAGAAPVYGLEPGVVDGSGTASASDPTVDLTNLRLVQDVENTRVFDPRAGADETVIATYDAPPLVSGRDTSVVFGFDFDLDDIDKLPPEKAVEVVISVDRTEDTREFEMTFDGFGVRRMTDQGKYADSVRLARSTTPTPPVFRVDTETTVVVDVLTYKKDLVDEPVYANRYELTPEIREPGSLSVAVVEIRDVGDEVSYGRVDDFSGFVDELRTYLEDEYPVDPDSLTVDAFPDPIDGTPPVPPFLYSPALDAKLAYDIVRGDDYDEVVGVVPPDYFNYHGAPDTGGIHISAVDRSSGTLARHPKTASLTEARASFGAHEMGHHFAWKPYPEPAAMRPDKKKKTLDRNHARTASSSDPPSLRSLSYDLAEGFGLTGSANSFMGYDEDGRRTDSIIHETLLDEEFEPITPDDDALSTEIAGELPDGVPADVLDAAEPVLSGVAVVSDDDVAVPAATIREGTPGLSTGDGPVEVTVRDGRGGEIGATSLPDSVETTDGPPIENYVPFTVPFPERATDVRIRHAETGVSTTVNPVARTVRDAIDRLPDRAFAGDPASVRVDLSGDLEAAETAIDEGNYETARDRLESVRATLESEVVSYDRESAGQPSKSELIAAIDDRIARLETLIETDLGPVERADTDDDGAISDDELLAAVTDWAAGAYTDAELQAIVRAWALGG